MAFAKEVFLFNPLLIPGCTMWFDGADPAGTGVLPANGSLISTWVDKSGTGNTLTAASAQPTFTSAAQNGQGVLTFNGSQNISKTSLSGSSFAGTAQNISVFIVFSLSNTNGYSTPFCWTNASTGLPRIAPTWEGAANGWEMDVGLNNPLRTSMTTPTLQTNNTFYLSSYFKNGGSTQISINGSVGGTATGQDTTNLSGYSYDFNVGNGFSSSGYWMKGNIGEILFYNTTLSTSNFKQVEGYLAWKWGLQSSLPGAHSHKVGRPAGFTVEPPSYPLTTKLLGVSNPFLPTQVSGCQLWLDSADSATLTLSGTTVTGWTNKTGGISATTGGGTVSINQAYLNGKTSVRFPAGAANYLSISSQTYSTTSRNFFMVVTTGASNSWYFYINNNMIQSYSWVGNPDIELNKPGANIMYTNDISTFFNNTTVLSIAYSSGNAGIFVNGTTRTTNTNTFNSGSFATGTSATTSIGGLSGNSPTVALDIYELIQYDGDVTVNQRQQVEGYLAWKWGLQENLPSGHPYKSAAPSTGSSTVYRSLQKNWTPTIYSGCRLWLDAADRSTITLSGSKVSQWIDKTGNTNVSQASASLQPTYISSAFNGSPTIQFTGVQGSSYTVLATAATSLYDSITSFTYFAILRLSSTAPSYPSPISIQNKITFYLNGQNNSSGFTGTNIWTYQGSTFVASANTSFPYDTNTLICLSLGSTQQFFLNGSSTVSSPSFSFGSGTNLTLNIGYSGYNTNDGFNGNISEVLVYTTALTTQQRQQVEGYLAWKWGLQGNLPATHPHAKLPPPPL